jgi:type IV secretion system protein VirB9
MLMPSTGNDDLSTYRRPSEMAESFEHGSPTTDPVSTTLMSTEVQRPQTPFQRPVPPMAPAPQYQEASATPDQIIETAQKEATQQPNAQRFINAVQVYLFEPGAIYEIMTAPGFVTMLHLRPGEEVRHLAAGDTSRWLIDVVGAGTVDSPQNGIWPSAAQSNDGRSSILIKPRFPLLQTNLVIATNEREYLIDLKSVEKTYHSAVEWTYPQRPVIFPSRHEPRRPDLAVRGTSKRNYIYSLQAPPGGIPPWAPQAVYDDGHRVYVEFAPSINDFRRPPIYLLDADGVARMVNYRTEANRYVVDELFERAALRIGNERVVIQRTLPRSAAASSRTN